MKPSEHTTLDGARTTLADVQRWARQLWSLHARIAPRFVRSEPRQRVLRYLQGIVSEIPRKNGWQLAEYAGEARPDGMQRLLSSAVWDVDGVRDDLRTSALEQLGTQQAILVIDETSFPKRGTKSARVGRQYRGTTGQVQNCQVGVFLDDVTSRGHTLIDRELYLPLDWTENPERCPEAGIPETVRFQTKPELTPQMLERIVQAGISVAWVVADSVYGRNLDLRNWLEAHTLAYVMAVACDEAVGLLTSTGRRRLLVEQVSQHDWHRLSMSEGTKGPRLFDWAAVPLLHRWQDDRRHWLLIRRDLADPQEKRYYLVFAPPSPPLSNMVEAIGARWDIEQDFENSKDLGLDQ